ncbi:QbdB protein [Klebsiella michiganensis]|uniref:QbdB protein n=1 Tax=Klebsiella michiganensis TaxID=1134687 RepID=A0A7H4MZH7_9ENTR|nr:QbdB protein [Klebsiella michiganensis]
MAPHLASAWSPATLWLATIPAHAVDLNSQDLIPAPAGTDAILAYFTYATRDSFTPTGGDEIKQGTGLDSFVSIFRYVHYMDVGGLHGRAAGADALRTSF